MKHRLKKIIPKTLLPLISKVYFQIRFLYFRLVFFHVKLRKQTSDKKVFIQIFLHKEYDIKIDFNPKLIIDAGANTGFSSLYLNKKFKTAEIFAIEPEKSNFNLLKKHTKNKKRITTINKGLWYKNTYLKIQNPNDEKWSFITVETDKKEDADVEVLTIKNILDETAYDRIDILKIDIEGAEKELFTYNYQEWLPKVRILIIEVHDEKKPGCSEALNKAISKYDFNFYNFGENLVFVNNNYK